MTLPPEAQLDFLAKLQRLLAEGDFTATYKYALLISISDLTLEKAEDADGTLFLPAHELGRQFVQLYWNQVQPYRKPEAIKTSGVLFQNNGSQAAVLTLIGEFRSTSRTGNLTAAMLHPRFDGLVASVARTVMTMPVPKLQNFGGCTVEFIYAVERAGVRLKPGVANCLRRFHALIQQLARAGWIRHIRGNSRNQTILSPDADLEQFLFSTSRQSLLKLADGLVKLEGKRCFFCGGSFTTPDVDHFIPVSQYHRDLGHNFVLSCLACNRSKSDSLAGFRHLEAWVTRIDRRRDDIRQISFDAGIPVDLSVTMQVAKWGYSTGATDGAMAWRALRDYEPITSTFVRACTTVFG